jgi:hypothetical protein
MNGSEACRVGQFGKAGGVGDRYPPGPLEG